MKIINVQYVDSLKTPQITVLMNPKEKKDFINRQGYVVTAEATEEGYLVTNHRDDIELYYWLLRD